MPRTVLSRILLGCLLVLTVGLSTAWAQGDCPPGYHTEGPRGCMPNGPGPYYPPPPPPGYYPAPCPPGMTPSSVKSTVRAFSSMVKSVSLRSKGIKALMRA